MSLRSEIYVCYKASDILLTWNELIDNSLVKDRKLFMINLHINLVIYGIYIEVYRQSPATLRRSSQDNSTSCSYSAKFHIFVACNSNEMISPRALLRRCFYRTMQYQNSFICITFQFVLIKNHIITSFLFFHSFGHV